MKVVGIDPGTGRLGYSVMEFTSQTPSVITYGCFEYPSKLSIPERLILIEEDITRLLADHSPDVMAIETLLFNRNITTAMSVAEARGVIELCAAKKKIRIQDCAPSQIKMAITGYGRADKAQIKQMVQLQLGLREMHKIDDAVDALAIAITGYHLLLTKR